MSIFLNSQFLVNYNIFTLDLYQIDFVKGFKKSIYSIKLLEYYKENKIKISKLKKHFFFKNYLILYSINKIFIIEIPIMEFIEINLDI